MFLIGQTSVSGFIFAPTSIFNRLGRAVADAGHTMCTVLSPYRDLVIEFHVIQRAVCNTFSTPNTGVFCVKEVCLYHKAVKGTVD